MKIGKIVKIELVKYMESHSEFATNRYVTKED